MATVGDFYVKLFDGSVQFISGVTATPTLVPESIMDAYYRDEGNTEVLTGSPVSALVETDPDGSTIQVDLTGVSNLLNDLDLHTAPRQLGYEISYWQFTVSAISYFFRWDVVQGFSNNPPSSF